MLIVVIKVSDSPHLSQSHSFWFPRIFSRLQISSCAHLSMFTQLADMCAHTLLIFQTIAGFYEEICNKYPHIHEISLKYFLHLSPQIDSPSRDLIPLPQSHIWDYVNHVDIDGSRSIYNQFVFLACRGVIMGCDVINIRAQKAKPLSL